MAQWSVSIRALVTNGNALRPTLPSFPFWPCSSLVVLRHSHQVASLSSIHWWCPSHPEASLLFQHGFILMPQVRFPLTQMAFTDSPPPLRVFHHDWPHCFNIAAATSLRANQATTCGSVLLWSMRRFRMEHWLSYISDQTVRPGSTSHVLFKSWSK